MVMENIYPPRGDGEGPRHAPPREGTKEITFAALAATLAVIAIFLPVVFMKGVIGKFFFQFGVTLSVAVCSRYFEAITLAPARCAQMLNTSREGRSGVGARRSTAAFDALERGYARGARAARCAGRWPVLVARGRRAASARGSCADAAQAASSCRRRIRAGSTVRLTDRRSAPSLDETDALIERAEAILASHPEVARVLIDASAVGSARMHAHAGRRRSSAALTAAAAPGDAAQGAQQHPRPARVGAGPRRSRASRGSSGYPVDFTRARLRLGHAGRAVA